MINRKVLFLVLALLCLVSSARALGRLVWYPCELYGSRTNLSRNNNLQFHNHKFQLRNTLPEPISFNTTGTQGTDGFCRIPLPEAFYDHNYTILVDGSLPLAQNELPLSNSPQIYLYFTYHNSANNIIITVPEFPTMLCLLTLILTIPLAAVVRKRQLKTKTKHNQK